MSRFNLPDGKYIDIPSDADRNYYINLQNYLAEQYPNYYTSYKETAETPEEPTLGGDLLEVAKGVPRGLASSFLSAGEGIVNLFDVGNDSQAGSYLKGLQQKLNESIVGPDEEYLDRFSTKFGQGLGSFASFLIPGTAAGKALGFAGKAKNIQANLLAARAAGNRNKVDELTGVLSDLNKAQLKAQTISAAALAVPVGISQQTEIMEEAKALGEEVGTTQEVISELLGGAIGFSEILAPTRLLQKITKADAAKLSVGERITSALATGGVEALQETMAGIAQDAVARGMYSDEIEIGDSAFDDFTVGGAVGFTADLLLRGIAGRSRIGGTYDLEQEKEARLQEQKVLSESRERQRELQKQIEEGVPFVAGEVPTIDPIPEGELDFAQIQLTLSEDNVEKLQQQVDKIMGTRQIVSRDVTDGIRAIENNFGNNGAIFYINLIYNKAIANTNANPNLSLDEKQRRVELLEEQKQKEIELKLPASNLNNQAFQETLPFIEEVDLQPNADGTISVIGLETGNEFSTHETIEEAASAAVDARKNIRNSFINDSVEQTLDIIGLSGNGTAYNLGQKIYNPLYNVIDARKVAIMDSRISPKRKERLQRQRKAEELETLGSQFQITQSPILGERLRIEREQGNVPVTPVSERDLDASLLEQLYARAEKIGLERKAYYTIPEMKKLLKPEDFNQALSEKAHIVSKISENLGELRGVRRIKDNIDVSRQAFTDLLRSKNIDTNFTSAEFEYLAEAVAGEKKFSKMNRGQKEILITRLGSLPRFDTVTKLPDYRPRPYTAQQLNSFYQTFKDRPITDKSILEGTTLQGLSLSKKQRDQFKTDLINSGRATKRGNRVIGNPNFDMEQAAKTSPVEESTQEFAERLRRTTELSEEQIQEKVLQDINNRTEPLLLPPPPSFETLEKLITEELSDLGLSDVATKFNSVIQNARTAITDEQGNVVATTPPVDAKGNVVPAEAEYVQSLQTIFFQMARIDPRKELSEQQLLDKTIEIMNHEAIHAMRKLDLLTEKEFQSLVQAAKKLLPKNLLDALERNYKQQGTPQNTLNEEYAAELFRVYRADPNSLQQQPKGVVNKVLNFFTGVLRAITGANFGNPFFVLQDIASGKIGARQRDVVRGLVSTGLFEDIAEVQRGKATGVDKVPEEPTAQEEEEKTAAEILDQAAEQQAKEKADEINANTSPESIPRLNNNASPQALKIAFEMQENATDDIATFSIAADDSLPVTERIDRLETRLYQLEREEQEEGAFMTPESLNKLQGRMRQTQREINYLKAKRIEDSKKQITEQIPLDIPTFKRSEGAIPEKYQELNKTIEMGKNPNKTFGETVVDESEWSESASRFLTRQRAKYIDRYAAQLAGIKKAVKLNPDISSIEARARTGAIQALRWVDKSKGVFAAMLKYGFVTLDNGLTSVTRDERLNLINIFAPIYQKSKEDNINYESLFKIYAIAKRGAVLNEKGIEVPLTEEQIAEGQEIGNEYNVIKEVYDNFQEYNNKTIDFMVASGLLSQLPNYQEIKSELIKKGIDAAKTADDLKLLDLANDYNSRENIQEKIEVRPTAQIWKDDSVYYPFYKKMVDDSIRGPNIGGGILTGNPLNIKIKGSDAAIDVAPLEAIFRNQISVVSAGMKNDALQKLMRAFVTSGQAREVLAQDAQGENILPVYIGGRKRFFFVNDPMFLEGLENMGVLNDSVITKILSFPATVLRETVTRDPGFILVNMFRDTLSAAVTSGAGFTPVVDTVKGFASDLSDLERFGVLGGYDYSADAESVVGFVKRQFRSQGIGTNGAMNPTDMVLKAWDFLGQATYRSDGATRKAVYDKVLERTGDEAEAAYQAAEIINFSRRGSSPIFRIVTTAIPFLNARIQGLDVLYRSASGRYSAGIPESAIANDKDAQRQVIANFLGRAGLLMFATGLYYAMVSDKDEYRARRREEREDNWLIFTSKDSPPLKLPVPFEVGLLFKTIPERIMDVTMGGSSLEDLKKTLVRGATTTLAVDPLGFQALKPFKEAYIDNRSGFTGSPIVPQYMEEGLEPAFQTRETTNELARVIGETFNISPIKLEYALRGYGGTLGTYLLSVIDATLRQFTGRDMISPRIDQMPVLKRFLATPQGGGLQQEFYELRAESNKVIQTINKLKDKGLIDEYLAYRVNNEGAVRTRSQILALDRYMKKFRDRRDAIYRNDTLTKKQKAELLEQLEFDRNLRLSKVPNLRREIETFVTDQRQGT